MNITTLMVPDLAAVTHIENTYNCPVETIPKEIPLSQIRTVKYRQNRESVLVDVEHVANLTAALKRGDILPAILVDPDNVVLDGHHRLAAVRQFGADVILAHVVQCDDDLGDLICASANMRHGKSVDTAWRNGVVRDALANGFTQKQVAAQTGLSDSVVAGIASSEKGRDLVRSVFGDKVADSPITASALREVATLEPEHLASLGVDILTLKEGRTEIINKVKKAPSRERDALAEKLGREVVPTMVKGSAARPKRAGDTSKLMDALTRLDALPDIEHTYAKLTREQRDKVNGLLVRVMPGLNAINQRMLAVE